jgi:hypothetical protein
MKAPSSSSVPQTQDEVALIALAVDERTTKSSDNDIGRRRRPGSEARL